MKTRYDAFYRTIPSLGGKNASRSGDEASVRTVRSAPHPVLRQPSVLEATHPEIIEAITLLWGYPEMNQYFEKLWLDDGTASPIAPEAMSELMLLAGVHRWLAPQLPARNMASVYDATHSSARSKDLWGDVPRRR